MRHIGSAAPQRMIVRTYGRGSVLGLLNPLLSWLMASRGMNGWQSSAQRAMADDEVRMARQGYRVATAEEAGIPALGIVWCRVTYERTGDADPR